MEGVKITTICLIQICEYEVPVWCERCMICIKPGTRSIRMVCSCGCGEFKSKCTRCPFVGVPECKQERERQEKAYKERRFICCQKRS